MRRRRVTMGFHPTTLRGATLVFCCCFLLFSRRRCLAFVPHGDTTPGGNSGGVLSVTRTTTTRRRVSLLQAWNVDFRRRHRRRRQDLVLSSDTTSTRDDAINEESSSFSAAAILTPSSTTNTHPKPPVQRSNSSSVVPICLYRNSATDNWWRQRIELKELRIGQELQGVLVQRHLEGKTGPKVFVDCGVGRLTTNSSSSTSSSNSPTNINNNNNDSGGDDGGQQWHIVNGMIRLPQERKLSVTQKRAARLAKKISIPVYVTKIYAPSGRLELSLTPPDENQERPIISLQSIASLQPGDEIVGVPTAFRDYGILMKLLPNYNRHGLLHISKVATACGVYVNQAAGLQRFASNFNVEANGDDDNNNSSSIGIPLVVLANNKKRGLELDLSTAFKQALVEERANLLLANSKNTVDLRTRTAGSIESVSSDNPSTTTTLEATNLSNSLTTRTTTKSTTTTAAALSTHDSVAASANDEYYAEYAKQVNSKDVNEEVDQEQDEEDEEYYDDDDDDDNDNDQGQYSVYDELDDIEDALGLGTY